MKGRKQSVIEQAREALSNLGLGVSGWAVQETPWNEKSGAQIRTAGGRLVAELQDADEARAVLECIRLLGEMVR